MNRIKLNLKGASDDTLRVFAAGHQAAIADNPLFPAPAPDPAEFDAALAAFSAKLDAIAVARTTLAALMAEKHTLRAALETRLGARANYVELTASGDEAAIRSAGFEPRARRTPTTRLRQPQNLVASMGPDSGRIRLACQPVPKARAYLIDLRDHDATDPESAWRQAKVASRATVTLAGLVPGRKYAFRIRALGPGNLESPWSDEAVCMAP
ncbi:MAG: fibronectin type III domain-containing protein [Verrucomicrobia bacterium]|nr:fibronectin type III domain-containing protein [Verrucomicrobiota bacterium]